MEKIFIWMRLSILRNKWEFGGFLLMILCVLVNLFPSGYIILGADILQPIRMHERFADFHYGWFGQVSLFYSLFYLLDSVGISPTLQISFYLGIFLIGSYVSFLTFAKLLFPDARRSAAVLVSIFYATNLYTLYVFTATWGYTHYQIVYVFIPILTALFVKALQDDDKKYTTFFLLVIFLASMSFGNPAFALSLGIYMVCLLLALLVFQIIKPTRALFTKLLFVGLAALLLNAYWLLPLLPQVSAGVEQVAHSEFIDLPDRLSKDSNAIFDTFRLLQTGEQKNYYPKNFPYSSISFLKEPIALLAFLPILFIFWSFFQKQETERKKLFLVFLGIFFIFIALIARVREPFAYWNSFLFQLPGINVLRGYDKTATFAPFLISALLLLSLIAQQKKKYFMLLLLFFAFLIPLLALPFYVGGLQTKMSYILQGQKKKDFTKAGYSALVKIPEPYYTIQGLLKNDKEDNKIAILPYSPGSSVGRVYLPGWKVNGPHIAQALYDKKFVELNDIYIPGWMFGEEFERQDLDPVWITDLYGLLGVKYVMYHKDAPLKRIEKMEPARLYLENKGVLKNIQENENFFLYVLPDDVTFPYLYVSEGHLALSEKDELSSISEKIETFRKGITKLPYKKESPKELRTEVPGDFFGKLLVLNERFDPLWKAVVTDEKGTKTSLERDASVKYANAWKLEGSLKNGTLDIYHQSLPLLRLGMGISFVTLLAVGVWVLRKNGIIK